ncbi:MULTISPECIES: flagellar basal body rod protein FlgB [Chromobacterium]|uniref:Flagellar basal body rod protein FlgB n=1 Tax=Chromobacterium aquaticum TaxID=467180 RepID=A0ABV8ZVZ8_9NEIS|nr:MULTISPECIES: flagellar basal body rod protein FlgB [Chromobacterium]KMN34927.1 flagellar basal-body rod protein FlgB [Chromobacterium sp. LK1]MCD5361179.1 flagellar basal body rod protein FlgB [Chromobacterium aquaticum]
MLDKIAKHFDFQQRALNLRAYRTEVLASNIANDETPNYKAVDFDFGKALQAQTDAQGRLAMNLTDAHHLAGASGGNGNGAALQYRAAVQPSVDGNTVDMDVERAAFADNAVRFQSTLTFLSKRISGLSSAIQGQGGNS